MVYYMNTQRILIQICLIYICLSYFTIKLATSDWCYHSDRTHLGIDRGRSIELRKLNKYR